MIRNNDYVLPGEKRIEASLKKEKGETEGEEKTLFFNILCVSLVYKSLYYVLTRVSVP